MAATTTLLGLLTPTQGTLSGTWGDSVNYGISDYVDIAIAGTLSFAGDGAITLANTTGSASGNGIGSTTAQYMVIRITGTQTVTKVITAPSYSKLYMVDHAGATSAVTFKAAGQTGVTVAVGEKCFVYYNGTDYVKVSSTVSTGVTSFTAGTTGLTPNTATTGAVTLAGTLGTANGGTNLTSFTSGGVVYASSSSALATGSALTFDGSTTFLQDASGASAQANFRVQTNTAGAVANGYFNINGTDYFRIYGTNSETGLRNPQNTPLFFSTNNTERMRISAAGAVGIGTSSPGAKLQVTTGGSNSPAGNLAGNLGQFTSSGGLAYITMGNGDGADQHRYLGGASAIQVFGKVTDGGATTEQARITAAGGFVVGTTTDPGAGIIADANGNVRKVPQSGSAKVTSYTLAVGDVGEFIELGASGAIVIPDATFAAGDVVSIFNNTGSTATITCSITTAYIAGTFTDKATMTLAAAGVATVLFISGTVCVVSGNVT